MEKKYYCPSPECSDNKEGTYTKVLRQESVMDEQNVAQMFCPRCKSRLKISKDETPAAS